jgi:ribA/ribD-fused uncharacterized protein
MTAFNAIAASKSPGDAKRLGRGIQSFDQGLWDTLVLRVAYEVVLQKFAQLHDLQQLLLSTGDRAIAEMTSDDSIWGTGVNIGSEEATDASKWLGSNILGWALMEARATLQSAQRSAQAQQQAS